MSEGQIDERSAWIAKKALRKLEREATKGSARGYRVIGVIGLECLLSG